MDFAFSDALAASLTEPEGWDKGLGRLYEIVSSDYLYANPMNLMLFADNHDRARIFSTLGEDVQTPAKRLDPGGHPCAVSHRFSTALKFCRPVRKSATTGACAPISLVAGRATGSMPLPVPG